MIESGRLALFEARFEKLCESISPLDLQYWHRDGQKVYFVRRIGTKSTHNKDHIKIGHTHAPIHERIKGLRNAFGIPMSDPMTVLLCIKGTREIEYRLHDLFEEHWYRAEWFLACHEIYNFIERIRHKGIAVISEAQALAA